VIGFIPLYLDLIWRAKERNKIELKLLRFPEQTLDFDTVWYIRILHPSKPIEHCSVSYNGVKLSWSDMVLDHYEKYIDAMSGDNIQLPKGIPKEDAIVVVRDGQKILRKKRFRDIPIVPT
jgi:hypothetical protein